MASRLASILVLVIVAATLIAGLIAGAQNESNGPVDLIVLNGRVYSGADQGIEEALAVRGNQILKVGSNREMRRLTRAQTTVIDARGGTVIPGFVEPQVDLVAAGRASNRLNLEGLLTTGDIDRAIANYAASHLDDAWIEGSGWDATLYDKLPTREALDALVPDRPAYVVSSDEHVMWANSKALEAAGIAVLRTRSQDEAIARDKRTGEPTGILRDSAQKLVADAVPALSEEDRQGALEEAMTIAHRAGVTSVQNVPGDPEDLQVMAQLRRAGEMSLRVYQLLQGAIDMGADAMAALDQIRREYPEVPLFKTGGVRIDVPTVDEESDRDALVNSLASRIAQLDKEGWQVVAAADDPSSVEIAVRAFELVPASASFKTRRHRIDAHDAVDADRVAELSRIGVTVTVVPSTPLDPLESVAAAVEHVHGDPKLYAQALRQAINRFTSNAARTSLDEQRKGTLAAGMLADFVILSKDVFAVAPSELKGVKVSVTVFDGKVVYDRIAATSTTY